MLSDPDPETATRVGWILTALLFLLAVVPLVGEFLGWENDLGEISVTVGTLGSLIVGVATYQHGADRSKVQAVHQAVRENGGKLETSTSWTTWTSWTSSTNSTVSTGSRSSSTSRRACSRTSGS